jgi:DNA-binding MarR family transcriptional regulator
MLNPQLFLGNQVCFPLYSVSRLITKAYKPYLTIMGVTYPQYLVLLVLWETDNIPVNEITEKLLLDTNTLSPLLQRMEKMGILKRKRSTKDERSVLVQLTQKGKELAIKAQLIPTNLINLLLTEKINIDEVLHLKGILEQWISILSNENKN